MKEKEDEGRELRRTTQLSNKRLLFDRRYGWVVDEWKNPSQEALAGGRGMFCILPLAKGLLDFTSYSINMASNSAIKIIERRDDFSPQQLQDVVGNQFQRLAAFIQKPGCSFLKFKGKYATSDNLNELESV